MIRKTFTGHFVLQMWYKSRVVSRKSGRMYVVCIILCGGNEIMTTDAVVGRGLDSQEGDPKRSGTHHSTTAPLFVQLVYYHDQTFR